MTFRDSQVNYQKYFKKLERKPSCSNVIGKTSIIVVCMIHFVFPHFKHAPLFHAPKVYMKHAEFL